MQDQTFSKMIGAGAGLGIAMLMLQLAGIDMYPAMGMACREKMGWVLIGTGMMVVGSVGGWYLRKF